MSFFDLFAQNDKYVFIDVEHISAYWNVFYQIVKKPHVC